MQTGVKKGLQNKQNSQLRKLGKQNKRTKFSIRMPFSAQGDFSINFNEDIYEQSLNPI